MDSLMPAARAIGERLKARGETVAVAESSAGGLIAASLLAVPGASAYFLGGAVIYTKPARAGLLGITDAEMAGMRSSSEPYALLLARTVRARLGADWGFCGFRPLVGTLPEDFPYRRVLHIPVDNGEGGQTA